MTTTTPRAEDARLHELLTGEKHVAHRLRDGYGNIVTSYTFPPSYHEDANDTRTAELALPPALQGDYASELEKILDSEVTFSEAVGKWDSQPATDYDDLFKLITATAQQRAQAMVHVLERARAKEVVE